MNKEKNDGPIIKTPQAIERPSKRPPCYRAEIPNPYKRPPCDSPEIQKPCSRCVGWGMKTCAHCRFWTDYEPGEDESYVNLPLSLARLREMDRRAIEQFGHNALGQFTKNWTVEQLERRFANEDRQISVSVREER